MAGLLLVAAPSALASPSPTIDQNLGAVREHLVNGSPVANQGQCDEICRRLRSGELRPGANAAKAEQLNRELRAIRIARQLLPALRVLTKISLAATAGELGWKIGSGANAKYLRIGLPAEPAGSLDGFYPGSPRYLQFFAEGAKRVQLMGFPSRYGNTPGDALMPEDGWALAGNDPGYAPYGYTFTDPVGGPDPGCQPTYFPSTPVQFEGFQFGPYGGFQQCSNGYYEPTTEVQYVGLYMPEGALEAAAPIEDYVDQRADRTTAAPANPDLSDAEVEAELDSGDYPTLVEWYEYQLGAPGACDPVDPAQCNGSDPGAGTATVPECEALTFEECEDLLEQEGFTTITREDLPDDDTDFPANGVVSTEPAAGTEAQTDEEVKVNVNPRRRRCDRSDAENRSLPDEGHDQFDEFTKSPPGSGDARFEIENPPPDASDNPPYDETYLRWGPAPARLSAEDGFWSGFGYRHIAAKHGWSRDDEDDTRAVLGSATPTPSSSGIDRWVFDGLDYSGRDGVRCERRVVVQYGKKSNDPSPPGIITSFGQEK